MVPMGPPRYRALSAGVVRKAVSKKSAKVGKLSAGEIIVSLGAEPLGAPRDGRGRSAGPPGSRRTDARRQAEEVAGRGACELRLE